MGLLDDDYKAPYSPNLTARRRVRREDEDNSAELNNFGRKPVSEDFEDSPFADRKPI